MRSRFGTTQLYSWGHNVWRASLSTIQQNIGGQAPQSGSGGGGGTPPAPGGSSKGAQALAWVLARLGKFAYLQGSGRLDPDHSGVTDCSGLCYAAYKYTTNTFVGTWTGDQYFRGAEPFPRRGGAMTAEERA